MLSEEESKKLETVRMMLAVSQNGKSKKQLKPLSLEEQRNKLRNDTKFFLRTQDMDENLVDSDEVQRMIEDFLVFSEAKKPYEVHAKTWTPWLTNNRKNSVKWQYSDRYLSYLTGIKGWDVSQAASIDAATDEILNHCGDPMSNNDFEIKGLVVGDIQSGKTANYTSLINKAIDVGYKVIIVLTGTTNDLRSQTQKRLDKEVAGFKTDFNDDGPKSDDEDSNAYYGVAKIDPNLHSLQILTNASMDGDLKKVIGLYQVYGNGPTFLAVIKKNKASLNSAIKFLKKTQASRQDPDGKMPLPVLLIDDEADLASVNTSKNNELSKSTGTNRLIRQFLFKTCRKFTYVGYTATPFANIFIKPHSENLSDDDADDIFPDDFIITLRTPPDYCGPREYFGIDKNTQDDDTGVKTDLLAEISRDDIKQFDCDNYEPFAGEKECVGIPKSLRTAIMCFLISTGAKISRGIIENCTMLVNVDTKIIFNYTLHANVKEVFEQECKNYLYDEETRKKYREYWEREMLPVSKVRLERNNISFHDNWDGIDEGIRTAISWKNQDSVKLIIGQADSIDYSKTKQGIFICVGGQKLSRGLTLEGLSVSYYGRRAQAMDALLQMGRWFGYRKGWLDLCRVFTTKDVATNFIEAAIAVEGFKRQIEQMNDEKATPLTFGLRVYRASSLLPTSRNKATNASIERISYSASISQTIEFYEDARGSNLQLVKEFISKHEDCYTTRKNFNRPIFKSVPAKDVLTFLKGYKSPNNMVALWREYIEKSNEKGELINWTIVLSSLDTSDKNADGNIENIGNHKIVKGFRTLRINGREIPGVLKIRALTSPKDYIGFFPDDYTPDENGYNYDNVRDHYTPDNCILVIYVVDLKERDDDISVAPEKRGKLIENAESTVGLGIWFPGSDCFGDEYVYANYVEQQRLHRDDDASMGDSEEEK